MTQVKSAVVLRKKTRIASLTVALATSLMASACAQMGGDLTPQILASNTTAAQSEPDNRSELLKATEYWGKAFAKSPRDADTALAYAKNLKAMGHKQKAFSVMKHAARFNSDVPEVASEYGRLALEMGQLNVADKALRHAEVSGRPDWKVISARGAVLARQGQYKKAISEFERALAISNNNPTVMNNLAMAHVMNGDPTKAEGILRQASQGAPENAKIKKNLALVLGLQGRYDESKKIGALAQNAATASSDTETLRRIVQLPARSAPVQPKTQVAVQAVPALKPTTANDTNKWDDLVSMAKANHTQ